MQNKSKDHIGQSTSLAFYKLRTRIVSELRSYWYFTIGATYAERWWHAQPQPWPQLITELPGDNRNPFKQINVSPQKYLAQRDSAIRTLHQNTLTLFVTLFEKYLLDATERAIYLMPELVSDSDIQLKVSEVTAIDEPDMRRWIARYVADKYMRGKTHCKMIDRLGHLVKWTASKSKNDSSRSNIEEWGKWELLRNSIVHLDGGASADLAKAWPERFPNVGDSIVLNDRDVPRVAIIGLQIAKKLDRRLIDTVIRDADIELLARELFVRLGIDDASQISSRISRVLGGTLPKEAIRKIISKHKSGNGFGGDAAIPLDALTEFLD